MRVLSLLVEHIHAAVLQHLKSSEVRLRSASVAPMALCRHRYATHRGCVHRGRPTGRAVLSELALRASSMAGWVAGGVGGAAACGGGAAGGGGERYYR